MEEWLDPLELDAALARTQVRARSWHRRLRVGPLPTDDPFAKDRWCVGKSTLDRVRAMHEADPMRRPLERWVLRLAEERIDAPWLLEVHRRWRHERRVADGPEREPAAPAELLSRVLSDAARRQSWARAWQRSLGPVADAVGQLGEWRAEVYRRLQGSPEVPNPEVAKFAEDWLHQTKDLCDALLGETTSLDVFVQECMGVGADEGWPAQLNPRTMTVLLEPLLGAVEVDPDPLPQRSGPASFVLATHRVGAAWRDATAPAHQPFAVAHDAAGLERWRTAALWVLVVASEPFAHRALRLSERHRERHVRATGRVLLLTTRRAALRVLLRRPALDGPSALRRAYRHWLPQALRLQLPDDCAGILPELHADDAARFCGWMWASHQYVELVQRYDEDWYRNPQATRDLRERAELSPLLDCPSDGLHGTALWDWVRRGVE